MQNSKNKIHHSFGYALAGVTYAFRDSRNIRIHAVIAVLVILASFILGLTKFEKIIILITIIIVIGSEMINTAIEEMVDLITIEHRQEAKRAKDVAAGMVLVAAIGSVVVGAVIFYPYLF